MAMCSPLPARSCSRPTVESWRGCHLQQKRGGDSNGGGRWVNSSVHKYRLEGWPISQQQQRQLCALPPAPSNITHH